MMDNQYNYYRPDSDENRGADNQQGFEQDRRESESSKTEKRLRKESRTCCRSLQYYSGQLAV